MGYTLIRNGTLIDGNGGEPLSDAAVLIEGKRIRAVGLRDTLPLPPSAITEVDAQGGFILPGFVDAHVHLMVEGMDTEKRLNTPFSLRFYEAIDHMRRTVEAGVTSVRDAGGADLGVKRAVEQGLVLGPRMQISISPLTITGGHGDNWMHSGADLGAAYLGVFAHYPGFPSGRCDGVEEVRKKVREVLRAGAEVIKVHVTGGIASPTDHPDFTQFSPEELAVIVQEGIYRRGVRVSAHAEGAEGIKNAVRAGVSAIEHGIHLDDEGIALMLEHGTFLVPTMIAPLAILEVAEAGGDALKWPEWVLQKARGLIEIHQQNMANAYQAGVRIAMGTDAGATPHGSNLRELSLMCQIGMTPMEAIVAATKVAAKCLGWENRVGTVEPDKLADIVVCRTDPLADIGALANVDNIIMVMKGGQIVKDRRPNNGHKG